MLGPRTYPVPGSVDSLYVLKQRAALVSVNYTPMATSLDFSPGPSSVRTALDELQSMLGDLSLDGGKRDGSAGTMKDEATGEVDWERVEILAKGCADSLRTGKAGSSSWEGR